MQIDVTTLYYLIVGTTILGALLTAWQRQFSAAHRRALDVWAVGQVLIALGCFMRLFYDRTPDFVSIGLSNLSVLAGYAAIAAGMMLFTGARVPRRFAFALGSIALGWLAWGQYASVETRIAVTSLVTAALTAQAAFALVDEPSSRPLVSQRFLRAMLALHGLFFLSRAGVTIARIEEEIFFTGANFAITMLEGVLWSAFLPVALFSMVRETAERALVTASETDFLTGIDNRRAFMRKATRLLEDEDAPASLAVFDLDHFKIINDRHGHAVGDEVLRLFCRVAEDELTVGDIFGRLGGEEFAVMFANCDAAHAQRIATTISQRYTAEVACRFALSLRTTVSAGIAEVESDPDLARLLREADGALYDAKTGGRDQAVIAAAPSFPVLPETRAA